MVEHNARFNGDCLRCKVKINNLVKVFAGIYDERLADRLTALTSTCATGEKWGVFCSGNIENCA